MTTIKTGKMKIAGDVKDSAFIYGRFCNWKNAIRCFGSHEDSATHKTAVEVVNTLPKTTGDVGEMLSLINPCGPESDQLRVSF